MSRDMILTNCIQAFYNEVQQWAVLSREPADVGQDNAEWEQDIADELDDVQEQADEEFQKKMEKYEQDLKLWKEQKQRKVGLKHLLQHCSYIYRILRNSGVHF